MKSKRFYLLTQRYDRLTKEKKNIFLILMFFFIFFILMQTLLFGSLDNYKKISQDTAGLVEQRASLLKQKEQIYANKAKKSQNNLLKQKEQLQKDIDGLLNKSQGTSYVSADKIPEILGKVIEQIGQLSIIDFRNKPVSNTNDNGLVKHFFVLKVGGSYQSIYELLNKLKEDNILHVSSIVIEKQSANLEANIEFYILNTNKNIISL